MNLFHVLLACLCTLTTSFHLKIQAATQFRTRSVHGLNNSRRLASMLAMSHTVAPQDLSPQIGVNPVSNYAPVYERSTSIDYITQNPTFAPTDVPIDSNSFFNVLPSFSTNISISNTHVGSEHATNSIVQQAPSSVTEITQSVALDQQAFRRCTARQWSEVLSNNYNEIRARCHYATQIESVETDHQRFQEAVITSIELLPSASFREAVETWSGFDRAIIVLDNELRADPALKEVYAEISRKAFTADYSLFQRAVKKPFDIAGYIHTQAQKAHQRRYEKEAVEQRAINKKAFSAEKIATLRQECASLSSELEGHITAATSSAVRREYKELLSAIKRIESQLEAVGSSPETVQQCGNHYYALDRLNEQRVIGFCGESLHSDASYHYRTGNAVQITLYKAIEKVIEKASLLHTEGITNQLNRTVTQSIRSTLYQYAHDAQKSTKEGDLGKALQQVRSCIDLQMYAKSIADGTFNYAEHFSPQVLERLEQGCRQEFLALRAKNTLDRCEHVQVCVGSCAQQPLHIQDGIIYRTSMRIHELKGALAWVGAGNHEITVKDYTLSEKARQLCAQNNIPTTTFTRCVGNHYQQVRHAQALALLNQSTDLCGNYPSSFLVSEMASAIMDLSQNGGQALARGNIEEALTFDTLAHAIYDMTSTHANIYGRLASDMQHQTNVAQHAVQGAVDSVVHAPQTVCHLSQGAFNAACSLYTNSDVVVGNIIKASSDICKALRNPSEIEVTKTIAELSNHLQQLTATAISKAAAMSPEERAYHLGSLAGDSVVFDNMFKALSATTKLVKVGAVNVARATPHVAAQAVEKINNLWATSLAALEQSIAKAELEILGKIHVEKPFAELAGAPYRNPFIHFSESLIEKTGADKVAAKAAEIGAQVEKAAVQSVKEKFFALELTTARGWNLSETGSMIEGRYYCKHALERMAPPTKEVIMELEARAIAKGYLRGSKEFKNYVQPRNIPPMVIEDTIKYGVVTPDRIAWRWGYETADIKVVLNQFGDVITVYQK